MVRIVRRGHDGVVTDDVETPAPSAEPQILRGLRSVQRPISTRRRLTGWIFGTGTVGGLTMVLVSNRGEFTVATALLMYLPLVVVTTAIGGVGPGVAAALVSPGVANWFLVPPYHTFRVSDGDNIVELVVFVSVAATVAFFAARAARREQDATVARADALVLGRLSQDSTDSAERVLELLAATFGTGSVGLIDGGGNQIVSIHRPGRVPEPDSRLEIGPNHVLLVSGLRDSPSERRLLPAFVSQLARSLERDHLRQLATEAEALARADELRNALLRSVSHDLRTPITTLLAHLESLQMEEAPLDEQERREYVEVSMRQGRRIAQLIEQLLEAAKLEAGQVSARPEAFPIGELLHDVVQKFALTARERGISLSASVQPEELRVNADIALLERVFDNLIENALRHTPDGGQVTVSARRAGGRARLSVSDSGAGMTAEEAARAFDRFYRGDPGRSTAAGQAGLGLAIVKSILDLHGTTISVDSSPGHGASFRFDLDTPDAVA